MGIEKEINNAFFEEYEIFLFDTLLIYWHGM